MFYKNLKKLREERKLSKAELARLLDIPYTTYNNYELENKGEPRISTLKKIAEIFKTTVDELLYDVAELQDMKFQMSKSYLEKAGFELEEAFLDKKAKKAVSQMAGRKVYIEDNSYWLTMSNELKEKEYPGYTLSKIYTTKASITATVSEIIKNTEKSKEKMIVEQVKDIYSSALIIASTDKKPIIVVDNTKNI